MSRAQPQICQIAFKEALACTIDDRRHLLLGNGFSISAHPRFAYSRLFDVAKDLNPDIEDIFRNLSTTNFEIALREVGEEAKKHPVRSGLLKAIAKVHPYTGRSIGDDEYRACGHFLEDFVGVRREPSRGLIFTTNYDLLLYWDVVRHNKILKAYDGFDSEGVWKPGRQSQVFYLHGGLHIFERRLTARGSQEVKLMWEPDRPLIKQILERLEVNEFPVFVSEGTSHDKVTALRRSEYLRKARRTFDKTCDDGDGVLFTIGHSLSEVDAHILDLVGTGRIGRVFVGIHSRDDLDRADEVAGIWNEQRRSCDLPGVDVFAFPTSECGMWRLAPE
jgi:hypothetical protein